LNRNRTISKSLNFNGDWEIRMKNPSTIGPFDLLTTLNDLNVYKSDVKNLKTMSNIVNLYQKYKLPLYRVNKSVYNNKNKLKTAIREKFNNKFDLYLEKEYEKMLNAYEKRSVKIIEQGYLKHLYRPGGKKYKNLENNFYKLAQYNIC